MNTWLAPLAVAALLAVAACTSPAEGPNAPTDELAARDACRTQAEALRDMPEGRGLVGAADFDRYVAECMRTRRPAP
jgi:hypothetical protein